jgi:serine protease Do
MMYEIDEFNHVKKTKKKPIVTYVAVGAIIGSLIGGGATGVYFNQQVDTRINQALMQQASQASNQIDQLSQQTTLDNGGNTVDGYSQTIQGVAEAAMPAVVGVRTIEEVEVYMFRGTGTQEVEGVGTGVIVSEDGLILTNQHVVSTNPTSVKVTLMDGDEYDAQILYSDANMDLAVIKIDATGLPTVELGDSDAISVGEVAIAIGNPLGLEYERSVTAGIVSALDRSIALTQTQIAENLIQTDAAINHGNSGGPLLDDNGKVIGINTYKLSDGEGMGFAIPINVAKPIINQVKETGEFKQALIGASFLDQEIIAHFAIQDIELNEGLYVAEIDLSSDAYQKGLREGDVVTHADGVAVDTLLDLRVVIHYHVPGETLELTVLREGETKTITAMLSSAN